MRAQKIEIFSFLRNTLHAKHACGKTRAKEREREKKKTPRVAREREIENIKNDARARTADERARGGGGRGRGEKRIEGFPLSLFFLFRFFFLRHFFNKHKHTNALRKERKKRKKEKHTSIMDESWEELKRNAILLGSWIALIRASTYIFGAFQKAD